MTLYSVRQCPFAPRTVGNSPVRCLGLWSVGLLLRRLGALRLLSRLGLSLFLLWLLSLLAALRVSKHYDSEGRAGGSGILIFRRQVGLIWSRDHIQSMAAGTKV